MYRVFSINIFKAPTDLIPACKPNIKTVAWAKSFLVGICPSNKAPKVTIVVISAPNLAAVVPALPVKVGPNLGPNTLVTLLPTPNVAPPITAAFVPVTAVLTVKNVLKIV